MSKTLILAESGFGKTSSIGPISREDFEKAGFPNTEIIGLDPKETILITATNKGLPIPNWKTFYTNVSAKDFIKKVKFGNRVITNDGNQVAAVIRIINQSLPKIKNVVFDDSNYVMQDYYMSESLATGYNVFKNIGSFMGKIFNAMEMTTANERNFIMLAHYEEYKNSNTDTISYRFKTVGKMVQDYITPEGKFELVLFGNQSSIEIDGVKRIKKEFVTNFDGRFPAKSPIGMFDSLYIPNDLGIVVKAIDEYSS